MFDPNCDFEVGIGECRCKPCASCKIVECECYCKTTELVIMPMQAVDFLKRVRTRITGNSDADYMARSIVISCGSAILADDIRQHIVSAARRGQVLL